MKRQSGLLDRLRLAGQVLTGRKSIEAQLIPTWQQGQAQYPEASFENNVRFGLRKNELIYACVMTTANTASQARLKVVDIEEEEQPDHPLAELLKRPNPYMDTFDFWAGTIVFQKLAGRAVYEIEYNMGGQPSRLWALRPDKISPVFRGVDLVRYEYEQPDGNKAFLEPRQVLDFKLFDPLNRFHAWPPVSVAARVGDVDNSLTDYLKLFMERGGVPPGAFITESTVIGPDDVRRIRADFEANYGGFRKWTQPMVLSHGASYQKIGLTFDEMGFDGLDARNEARICMVLDVPPIVLGAKIGLDRSTYSNYEQAEQTWWYNRLIPLYKNFGDTLRNQLLPLFGDDGIDVAWDFAEVPALQENTDAVWKRSLDALRAGSITLNEFRAMIGEDDIGPMGEVFYQPLGVTVVPAKRLGMPMQPVSSGDTMDDEEDMPMDDDMPMDGDMDKQFKATVAANAPDDDERRRIEKGMEGAAAEYLTKQEREILRMASEQMGGLNG